MTGLTVTLEIRSRSGKSMGTFTITNDSTVYELKTLVHQQYPKYGPERQWFTIGPENKTILKNGSRLSEYVLRNGDVITFKDLGPQIGWRTVFMIEYFGPILIHSICFFFPRTCVWWIQQTQCRSNSGIFLSFDSLFKERIWKCIRSSIQQLHDARLQYIQELVSLLVTWGFVHCLLPLPSQIHCTVSTPRNSHNGDCHCSVFVVRIGKSPMSFDTEGFAASSFHQTWHSSRILVLSRLLCKLHFRDNGLDCFLLCDQHSYWLCIFTGFHHSNIDLVVEETQPIQKGIRNGVQNFETKHFVSLYLVNTFFLGKQNGKQLWNKK